MIGFKGSFIEIFLSCGIAEGSRGIKILCVDLCEKNFPKCAKTCQTENAYILNS